MKKIPCSGRRVLLAAGAVVCACAKFAGAATQEEVFRSINQNMDAKVDYNHLLPWLCGLGGLVVVVMFIRQRQKRAANPTALNHPGKLMREMARMAGIEAGEMKRVKALAQEVGCESPLTVLLCPSLGEGTAIHAETEPGGA